MKMSIRRINSANSVPDPFGAPPGHHLGFITDHPLGENSASSSHNRVNGQSNPASREPSIGNAASFSSGLNIQLDSDSSSSDDELESIQEGDNDGNNKSPSNVSVPSFMSTTPPLADTKPTDPVLVVDAPSGQLICPLCGNVFQEPVIAACGHTFCRKCITENLNATCPTDEKKLTIVVSNIAVSDQINELMIHCKYGVRLSNGEQQSYEVDPEGCTELVKLGLRGAHESDCGYKIVNCPNNPNCPRIRQNALSAHLATCQHRQCPNSVFTCNYVGTAAQLTDHLSQDCAFEPIKEYLSSNNDEVQTIKKLFKQKDNEVKLLQKQMKKLSDSMNRLEVRASSKIKALEENYFGSIQQINELRRSLKTLNDEMALINARLNTGDLGPYDPQHQYKCRGTFVGHHAEIWCLITSGDILISGSADKTIKVWDKASSFKCLQSLEGHSYSILSLHSCGKYLYSGAADGTVIIWDLDTYEHQKTLCASDHGIGSMATGSGMLFVGSQNFIGVYNFSCPWDLRKKIEFPIMKTQWVKTLKTNDKFLFCGTNGQIKIYDHSNQQVPCVKTLSTQFGYIYSLDLSSKILVAGCQNGKVLIYDINSFEPKGTLEGHVSVVHAVAILQAPGNTKIFSASQDRSIRVWSFERMICTQNLIRHAGPVTCIAISRGLIFSGSGDSQVKVWQ